jgi:predicted RNA-binding Zn-ribbon protein involved in translation (DUF1610 family)
MNACHHKKLVLLPGPRQRLRCRHCHLTISADELGDGHCPECFERSGYRRNDFEAVPAETVSTKYRCETCGALIGK